MLTFERAVVVAVVGAQVDVTVESGPSVGWGAATALPAGATVRVGRVRSGARAYVGIRGGVVPVAGDRVDVGPDPATPIATEAAAPRPFATTLAVWPGPRADWFDEGAWHTLTTAEWEVTDTSRVGTRLGGPVLTRVRQHELPSEGLIEGAIQVPPDGQPIVMLADHPTTGGYPVIAVVDPAHVPALAQAAPGTHLRLRPKTPFAH